MKGELDTSWFDLKNYEKLNELDLIGWHRQLIARECLQRFLAEIDGVIQPELISEEFIGVIELILSVITDAPVLNETNDISSLFGNPVLIRDYRVSFPFNTSSVKSTEAADFWSLRADDTFNPKWKNCGLNFDFNATEEQRKLRRTPINLLDKDVCGHINYVTVNLQATNEQIISDFQYWLIEYRKFTGIESSKKTFTEKDLAEWIKFRILPYIDLTLFAKYKRKKIKDSEIAKLIFDNDDPVIPTERLRKTTKPKAEWLLKESTIETIFLQEQTLL